MTSKHEMNSVPRVVSDVRRTRLYLGVKYDFIKNGGVAGFILRRLLFIRLFIVFGVFCCVVRLDVSSCITIF